MSTSIDNYCPQCGSLQYEDGQIEARVCSECGASDYRPEKISGLHAFAICAALGLIIAILLHATVI